MNVPIDEHERTLAFAETALGQIKALGQSAAPRNFEIWYHYATGYNQPLNQTINETLAQKGSLDDDDLDQIYETYISDTRFGERIDTVGTRVLDEIKQVMSTIDAATGSASSYSQRLTAASEKLAQAKDGKGLDSDALRAVIEHLAQGANEMEASNRKLEARLAATRQEMEQLQNNLEAVRTESLTDQLTSLANRKYFDAALAQGISEAAAKSEPLSLLMADIDHFKTFNDRFGHLTGDQVLRLVALSVKQNVKNSDIAARYGGEEFVIALPNTPLDAASAIADQIRRSVMTKELMKRSTGERLGRVTISIGVAALRPEDNAPLLIERADRCLYAAKRNGRNKVICENEPEAQAETITRVRVA
jgi:diguanylate cyclase